MVPSLRNSELGLSEEESDVLVQLLEDKGDGSLSFSMFCLLIRDVIASRASENAHKMQEYSKARPPSLAELFLTEEEAEYLTERIEIK